MRPLVFILIFFSLVTLIPSKALAQENPNTMLLEGAYQNDIHMVLNALILHANIDTTSGEGATALHMAVAIGNIDMVKVLLHNGASTDISDYAELTPLMMAVRWGRDTIVDLLLQYGADYSATDSTGKDAFIQAVQYGNIIPADILLYYGAAINTCDNDSSSALSIAVQNSDYLMVDFLLSKGAESNIQDISGRTPLIYAAYQGDTLLMRKLLNAGALPQHIDRRKKGVIEYAFESGNTQAFQWILTNIDGVKENPLIAGLMDEAYRNEYHELLYNLKNKGSYTTLTPIPGGVVVQWQFVFNSRDFMMGPYFALAEHKYKIQIGTGMAFRFWDKRVITGYMLGGPQLQVWEDRSMIYFNQQKNFTLIRDYNKRPLILASIGIIEGYTWGSYRGMSYEPWVGWFVSPKAGIQICLGQFYIDINMISINTRSEPVQKGKLIFGMGWKIPFKKHSVI